MSEHYYRVGVHGPPNPDEHPWVMVRQAVGTVGPEWQMRSANYVMTWDPSVEWTPWEPPSELAPVEDQGVEVRGYLYRQRWDGDVEVMRDGKWLRTGTPEMYRDYAEIAAALGLVDQPPVPKALVDWLRQALNASKAAPGPTTSVIHTEALLHAIEAGEFGPVEPTDADEGER